MPRVWLRIVHDPECRRFWQPTFRWYVRGYPDKHPRVLEGGGWSYTEAQAHKDAERWWKEQTAPPPPRRDKLLFNKEVTF